jgi:hypothetical protein
LPKPHYLQAGLSQQKLAHINMRSHQYAKHIRPPRLAEIIQISSAVATLFIWSLKRHFHVSDSKILTITQPIGQDAKLVKPENKQDKVAVIFIDIRMPRICVDYVKIAYNQMPNRQEMRYWTNNRQ